MKRRVVVTGMGGLSPLGQDWKTVSERLESGRSSIEVLPSLGDIGRMDTRLASRVPVWVELGLECANEAVLTSINRLHTVAEFEDAVARCHAAKLVTVGHAILGLPGDGREGARRTALVLRHSGVWGVKVHQLMVLERTQMAASWRRGELETLEPEAYVSWLADFVERLGAEQVLHRLTGDSPPEKHQTRGMSWAAATMMRTSPRI